MTKQERAQGMWLGHRQSLQLLGLPKEEQLPFMVRGCPLELPNSGGRGQQARGWGWGPGCKGLRSPDNHRGPLVLSGSSLKLRPLTSIHADGLRPDTALSQAGPRTACSPGSAPRSAPPRMHPFRRLRSTYHEMHDLGLQVRTVT